MPRYENKVVLITGGGGGIGKAAARRFLDEGAQRGAQRHPRGQARGGPGRARPKRRARRDHAGQVTTREQAMPSSTSRSSASAASTSS